MAGKRSFTALELVQLVQCSDVPSGALSVLCARDPDALAKTLAEHMDVDGIWYFGTWEGSKMVETASACNMKRVFGSLGQPVNWYGHFINSKVWLHEATQVKTIWIPFGA